MRFVMNLEQRQFSLFFFYFPSINYNGVETQKLNERKETKIMQEMSFYAMRWIKSIKIFN